MEDIRSELVLERALKKDRERVVRLIDSTLLHLPICQTNDGVVGACCNCGIERLKMDVENGEEATPKDHQSSER